MKPRRLSAARLSFPLAMAIAALLAAPTVHAASGTWTGGAATANWGFLANWNSSTEASGAGFTATFGNSFTNGYTISLNASRTIGNITLNNTAVNNFVINQINSAVFTFDVTTGSPTVNVTNAVRTLSINVPIGGSDGMTKSGPGTFVLGSTNTFTGATIVSAGTLTLGNSLALQNSSLNTATSIAGTSSAGLKTTVTSLTLGGLSGNKNLASVFRTDATGGPGGTTALGGYSGVTALTLNPTSGTVSYSGVIADGAVGMTLSKSGAGTQTITNANTYTGATSITGGTLALGDGTGNTGSLSNTSGITVTGATLAVNRTGAFTQATDLNGKVITGTGGFSQIGSGTTTLSLANNYTGNTTVTGGTLNITGVYTGDPLTSTLLLGTAAANTVVNVSNDMSLLSIAGANLAGSNSVYNQTAGTVNVSPTSTTNNYVAKTGYGYFNLTGGTYKQNSNRFSVTDIGASATGVAYVGGTGILDLTTTSSMIIGYTANGSLTVGTGGSVLRNGGANQLWLTTNTGSTGTINIAGGSMDTGTVTAAAIRIGNNTAGPQTGFINLAKGSLTMGQTIASQVTGTGTNLYANYAGGTLKASADLPAVLPVTSAAITVTTSVFGPIDNPGTAEDFAGGLTVDTNSFSVTHAAALLGVTGNGVKQANITVTGGSGYIGAPMVQFTGGTGTPAAGYAVISGGAVTGIVITSPGDYSVDPTGVTLTGGGGTGASVALSALTPNAPDSGLTKLNNGTLTLTGANTYVGPTLVSAGTLQLDSSAATTPMTSSITVNAGGTLGFTAGTADPLDLTGKSLTLGGGALAFDIGASGVNDAITVGNFTLTANSSLTFNSIAPVTSGASYTILTSATPITTGGFTLTGTSIGKLSFAPTINTNSITIIPSLDEGIWNQTGGGNWSLGNPGGPSAPNWNNYKPTVAGDAALFGSAIVAPSTINVDTAHSVGYMRFDNSNAYTIGNGASSNLTIDNGTFPALIAVNSGAHTIAENILLNSDVIVSPVASTTLSVSGALSGLGSIQKIDAGVLELSGANTYTGTTTIDAGTLSLTGALTGGGAIAVNGSAILSQNGTGAISGTSSLTYSSSASSSLGGTNTHTGATTFSNGLITMSGSGTLSSGSSLTLSGGKLDLGATSQTVGAFSITAPAASGDTISNGNLTGTSYAVSSTTGTTVISANLLTTGAFTKTGAGIATLSGANTYVGNTTVNNGILNITGSINSSITAAKINVNPTAGNNAVVNYSGGVSSMFAVTGATVAGTASAFNMTAGTVTISPGITTGTQSVVGAGNAPAAGAGAYGYYNITGGTFRDLNRFTLTGQATASATNGTGVGVQTAVVYVGGTGIIDQTGGEWMLNYSLGQITVADSGKIDRTGTTGPFGIIMNHAAGITGGGYGVLNLAGASAQVITGAQPIRFGNSTTAGQGEGQSGFVNVAAGTLSVGVNANTSLPAAPATINNAYFNFAGGTVKATGNLTGWIPVSNAQINFNSTIYGAIDNPGTATDFTGGLTVDTNGFAVNLPNPLKFADGAGVTQADLSLSGGSGYVGAPAVIFSSAGVIAGGSPAAGYAVISGGAVTGIVITSPGTYTIGTTPTITLIGGGGAGASVLSGALNTPNTSGGLTKTGAGILTLSGANTYTGATAANVGTLKFSTAVSAATDVTVAGSASAGALVATTNGQWLNAGDLSLATNSNLLIDYGSTAPSTSVAPISVENLVVGTNLGIKIEAASFAGLTVGQSYPLITWTTSGPVDGSAFTSILPPRLLGNFSVTGNTLFLNVTENTAGQAISWNTGDGIWNTSATNWVNANLTSTAYFDLYDLVLFGDATGATGNPTITLNSAVAPVSMTMNSILHDYTISGSGGIGGTGGLTLDALNTKTLTLATVNTYTGATVINGGTLKLSGSGTLGAAGSLVSVSSGALLDLNGTNQSITFAAGTGVGTVANNSGAGTSILTLSGTPTINGGHVTIVDNTNSSSGKVGVVITKNTQPLSNLNTYSGGTTINDGAFLYIGAATPLGAGTGPIDLTTAGTVVGTGSGLVVDGVTYANDITGAGYVHNNASGASTTVFTGNINTSGPFIFRAGTGIVYDFAGNGTTSVLSGVIGSTTSLVNGAVATGSIIKSGTGTLTLSGPNIYSGSTTVSEGILNLSGNRTAQLTTVTVGNKVGSTGTLNISNGTFTIGTTGSTFQVGVGEGTAVGILNQSGGNLTTTGNQLLLGTGGTGTAAGSNATGTYNLSAGTLNTIAGGLGVTIGTNIGTTGVFNLSGTGNLNMAPTSTMQIGRSDGNVVPNTTGTFTQTDGTAAVGILRIGGAGATTSPGTTATLSLSGGTFSAVTFNALSVGNTSVSTINIGGTADVTLPNFPTTRGTSSTATLNFNGGILRNSATGTFITNLTSANINGGGATFDTTLNSTTISQDLLAGTGSGGLTKQGANTLALTGANTYTGATAINGGNLQLGNGTSTGSLNASSAISVGTGATFAVNQSDTVTQGTDFSGAAITGLGGFLQTGTGTTVLNVANGFTGATTVNKGTLQLAFGGVSVDILSSSSTLTLGGGTLQLTGTGAQTVNGLTTNAGTSSGILLGANQTLTLGALTSAGAGSSLNFNTAAGGANATTPTVGTSIVVLTGQTAGIAINSGFTVTDVGGFGLATVNASNQVVRMTGTLLPATGALAGTNYFVDNNAGGSAADGSSSLIVTASQSTASITVDTTAAIGILTLNPGSLLSNNTWNFGGAGTNTYQITGNTSGAGLTSVATNDTISINNYNTGVVTIASPILANGTNNVVLAGSGTTAFSGANTYTGTTNLDGGILNANASEALGDGSATNTLIFNGGSLQANGTITSPATRGVTLTSSGVIDTNGNPVNIDGIIGGAGGLTKSGAGTLTLTAVNTFTGTVAVNVGTLALTPAGALTMANTFTGSGALDINPAAVAAANVILSGNLSGFTGTVNVATSGGFSSKMVTNAAMASFGTGTIINIASGGTWFNTVNQAGITVNLFSTGNSENLGALRMDGGTIDGTSSVVLKANASIGAFTTANTGTINAPITEDGGSFSLTKQGTGAITLGGMVSNTNGINVTLGTLRLGNSGNTYTGTTAISAAAAGVIVSANGALGAVGTGNDTTVGANGVLGFTGGINYTALEKIIGSGAGNAGNGVPADFTAGTRGFIQSVSGSNTFAGAIELSADGTSRIGTQDGAQLTLSGAITQGTGITTANILFRVGSLSGDFVTLSNTGNSFGGNSQVFTGLATAGQYAGVRLGANNALPTNLTISGLTGTGASTALDLNGKNQTLNGLITGGAAMNIINLDTVNASTLTLNPTADTATTNTLILGGSPGGTPLGVINLVKEGAFTQTLSGASSYTGNISITNGTLISGAGSNTLDPTTSPLGNPQTAGRTITTDSTRTLSFGGNDSFGNGNSVPLVKIINNGGTINNTGNFFTTLGPVDLNGGTINAIGGANTNYGSFQFAGKVTVGGAAASTISASGTNSQMGLKSVTGTIFDVADVTASSASDLDVSAVLANVNAVDGILIKDGAGTMTLTGANTFSGDITVDEGTLIGAGATNSPGVTVFGSRTNTRKITVNNGGTLQFNSGNILGASHSATTAPTLIINSGGVVTNGDIATNNALNDVELNGGTLTSTTGHTGSTPPNLPVYGAWNLNGSVTSTGISTISTSDPTKGWIMLKVAGTTNFAVTDTLTVSAPVVDNITDGNIGSLSKSGVGTMILSGINSYNGNTTVNEGTLELADNAQLKFVIGDTSGINNSLTGAGTVTLNGDFVINTIAADALASGSWTLENVPSLSGAYGSTFNVVGFTDAGGNKWTKANGSKVYTFDETTGILTLAPGGYSSWAAVNAIGSAPNQDKDGDGVPNAIEYVLGGTVITNDLSKLPQSTISGTNLIFTFQRKVNTIDAATDVKIEVGTTLAAWPDVYIVGADTASSTTPGVVVAEDTSPGFDTITLTVPMGTDPKKFARLFVKVTE